MRILIAGGGIAGLALAKALEQRGIVAELAERQSGEPAGGAGLYLPGNAARALGHLGLLEEVQRRAVPIEAQTILDWRGRVLSSTRTGEVWRECGPCLSLPRNELQTMLQGALRRTSPVFGKAVAGLTPSAEGCQATFTDGSSAAYDLVVGADGVHSTVRRLAFPGVFPRYVGNVCWRLITRNTTGIDAWTAMLGNGRTLLAIPVSATHVYVYADMAVSADEIGRFSARTPLASLFADFAGPVSPLITELPEDAEVHFGRIEEVRTPHWVSGRVVLIGDAAHAASPSMAEGAGMAMEDALVLADALSGATDPGKALADYAARRRPRVEWVQAQCAARDRMRALPSLARRAILTLFGRALYRKSYTPLLKPI